MKHLILAPTPQAQWQLLIHEAQTSCDRHLDEVLESYLIFLLMRFTNKAHCTSRIMAEDYLQASSCHGGERIDRLRDVGDHCLLFSGLFPHLADRRMVSISYFVTLGRSAYLQLSDLLDRGMALVYGQLSEAFIVLVDVLHAMRELNGHPVLTPIQAIELWQDYGSRRCYERILAAHTRAVPVSGPSQTH